MRMYSIAEKRWSVVPYLADRAIEENVAEVQEMSSSDVERPVNDPSVQQWFRQESPATSSSSSSSMGFTMTGTPPKGRNGHTSTKAPRVCPQTGKHQLCLFILGGWLGSGPLAADDLHILDITNPELGFKWLTNVKDQVTGPAPGPCNMHSADYIPSQEEIYVFRGGDGQDYLNDLHALHTSRLEWRIVDTKGEKPQQRANHSSAYLGDTEELVIMGGWNGRERLNDVYILDTTTSVWSKPEVGGIMPPPRAGMTLTTIRNRLYLFGGSGRGSKCFSDLHVLDRSEMAWLEVVQSNPSVKEGSPSTAHLEIDGDQGKEDNGLEDTSTSLDRVSTAGRKHSANPNEIESLPTISIRGSTPTRRAGHTATAVNDRFIYLFGGSCGTEYINDFHLLDTDPPEPMNISTPTSLVRLSQQLRQYCNCEEFSDVVFVVEGREIYAHKVVLSLASEYYEVMFTKGFREGTLARPEIVMEDVSYEAFLKVMEYIYSGEYPNDLHNDVETFDSNVHQEHLNLLVDLLILADRLLLDNLKQCCEQHLQPMVIRETVEFVLQLAQKTNAEQLEAFCSHFQRNEMNSVK